MRDKRVFPTNSVFIKTSKVEDVPDVAVKVSNEKQDEGRRRGIRIEDSFDVKHKAESSPSKDREMEIPFPKLSNGIVPSCLSLPR